MIQQCCAAAKIHIGTPSGRVDKVHGLDCYIATPPTRTEPEGVIIILPHVFGWELVDTRILEDAFATKGSCLVYLLELQDAPSPTFETSGLSTNRHPLPHLPPRPHAHQYRYDALRMTLRLRRKGRGSGRWRYVSFGGRAVEDAACRRKDVGGGEAVDERGGGAERDAEGSVLAGGCGMRRWGTLFWEERKKERKVRDEGGEAA
ncbi:dienelactone hydrolase family protein [Diplodia corticola]|uniref:Dienelactone hydrolase family protein n=1 Tax=Diplodia corticola TaxID=236234 RepID=A0A1J9S3U1_9PEZI|nr:dienelactone hydrolase family protein [Diplodia corticola]OJD34293.1 dienelactone hydrolase family protein [Diplodia corticola]